MVRRYLLRKFFGSLVWYIPSRDPVLFLTFDDGPIPEVTPWVLDQLSAAGARATFFCVGDNVKKYPHIYADIQQRGHAVGNHTMHHLNGWKTPAETYLEDVQRCADYVKTPFFRPPYGKLSRRQQKQLIGQSYRIVMWDVLSKDYDTALNGSDCLRNVLRHATAGSIVVFHDSLKAADRLHVALPEVLEHFKKRGFRFESLAALSGEN